MRAASASLLAGLAACLAAALPARPAKAADAAAQRAADAVQAALERGHGGMCSLSNVPVATGGYWRCLDIPPYRFVAGYGRMTAFVVVGDQPPYPVMVSEGGEAEFTARGRWMSDMGPRVARWWDDEVMGGRAQREAYDAGGEMHRRAEEEVGRMSGEPAAAAAPPGQPREEPAPPVAPPQPQVPATRARPAAAAEETAPQGAPYDLRSMPIPASPATTAPPGGVLLAPGVVRYPNGTAAPGRR